MTLFVALLVLYTVGLAGLGLWIGRRVRASTDFFVAGRALGPGLLFATFLAANIGAGSTVGATGYAYRDGLAAWWWNGSAGLGSLVLAFWIGPMVWREAKRLGLMTVGDFLEHHFGRDVRGLAAAIIWLGSFFILCGQLRGAAEVLERVAGLPLPVGALVATIATTTYFIGGGLLSAAWVNQLQLVVIIVGFVAAAPYANSAAGGLEITAAGTSFWRGETVGWPTLFLLGPAFFLSPGLIQKAYGARSERTLTRGIAWNGLALMAFSLLPVILGLAARTLHPGLERAEMALPAVLASDVPYLVGAIALAAVFSAELSSADAVLFMLSTSGARDFYKGFFRPHATDADVLRVARWGAVVGALAGYGLTFVFDSVASALTLFYSVMVVTLFAPILGALFLPRGGRWGALASMLVGVMTLVTIQIATKGLGYGWATPAFLGMLASGLTYLVLAAF
ncbi:MAG: sodium:solute symporter family protein [Vicinamibacterales bacterium]